MSSPPKLTIVLSTYNRCEQVVGAIQSILNQDADPSAFDLIVVDNNSTDRTREIVMELAESARDVTLRYMFEPMQGVSYARNRAIRGSATPLVAFTDDDVRISSTWVSKIMRTFEEHPDVDFVGGKVLPEWDGTPPPWLVPRHWAPLALVDYGDAPTTVDARNPICLVTANLAVRRRVFDRVGVFSPAVQRVKNGIGSLEDQEILLRAFAAGFRGLYDPTICVTAPVPIDRVRKSYHRRWHRGNGHFYAILRQEDVEATNAGRLLGVPLHLYRAAASDAAAWVLERVRGNPDEAFARGLHLNFCLGFLRTRIRQYLSGFRADEGVSSSPSSGALVGPR
jgi:glycosyltransferase involved in cell wall biosynthesis